MELCAVCAENETGRLIGGIPVCGKCFVEGGLNFPKNQAILKKVYDSPYEELQQTTEPAEGEGFGDYLCPKCKVTHRTGSKVHKRHLKLL